NALAIPIARRTSATAATATVPTSACVYGLNTSLLRSVATRAPAIRRLSRRTPSLRLLLSMVQHPVEGIEVAPAPVDIEVLDAAVHHQRHRLFREAAVRAQRRIQAREVVLGRRATEGDRTARDPPQIADPVGRQLEAAGSLGAREHHVDAAQRRDPRTEGAAIDIKGQV